MEEYQIPDFEIIDNYKKQSQEPIPNSSTNEYNTNGITKYEIS